MKETDRIAALAAELTKLGDVAVDGDDLTVHPPEDGRFRPASIDTYDDHRMAMSFAAGTRTAGVRIRDPQCVNKTYWLRSTTSPNCWPATPAADE